jgi:YbbR domain-containing protein
MQRVRYLVTHNWLQKLFALVLAFLLWVMIATETSSEIGLEVPLEYRNIPADHEVTGDAVNTVEVRVRGPAALIREISPQDVSTTIDVGNLGAGERVVSLTSQNIRAPFGIEVVRVAPARVYVTLERTISKTLPVVANLSGTPAAGFRVQGVKVSPSSVRVHGPASKMHELERIATTPIVIEGMKNDFQRNADLDLPDPLVRVDQSSPVRVVIEIREQSAEDMRNKLAMEKTN